VHFWKSKWLFFNHSSAQNIAVIRNMRPNAATEKMFNE